jgi:hypothetical protein
MEQLYDFTGFQNYVGPICKSCVKIAKEHKGGGANG